MGKKWIIPVLMTLLLAGCKAEATFETVEDEYIQTVMASAREIVVTLPEEAAAPAAESGCGRLSLLTRLLKKRFLIC